MAAITYLVSLWVTLVFIQVAAEPTCLSSNLSEMRVTFDSHRNKTGLWTHEIGLEHQGFPSGQKNNRNAVPWTVDVKYAPKNCDDKQEKTLKVLMCISERQLIPADYEFIPGLGYYKYYPTLVTWDAAKATCDQDGAHLAIINSQQEADALKKMVVNTNVDWTWLGLTKNLQKGEFVTVLGEPLSATFNKWHSGVNPANAPPNSAAVIHKTLGTLSYDTAPTTTKYPVICEQD